MRRGRIALALVGLAALAVAAPAQAAIPRATLADLEDEVMCPICGTLLELSQAPQAERQRALIRRLIAAGRSKDEIKDRLVAEYGSEVLATPDDSGFDLAAWVVPIVAFVIGAAALAVAVGRWRRRGLPAPGAEVEAPGREETERLDRDLARYDL
jgi:cytochrome c-type biogenesis protein CcmH